jgi:hypothetical protein
MKKLYPWLLFALLAVIALSSVIYSQSVLDSQRLYASIEHNLPPGTPKSHVIQFIQAKKPVAWDDLGTHVKARLTGRAGNLLYRKDIVLDFEFDTDGRLLSFSKSEYLTGL